MTTITISAMAISVSSVVASISILSSVLLIGLLAGQEILQASNGEKHKLLAKSLMIGTIPLLLGFMVIVVMKVLEILS
jgi:ABC-type Fe3+-siderophore transport system permease subunit